MTPEGQIYVKNSKFWQSFALYSHIFTPINVKFGTGERTECPLPRAGPLPRAKFHVYQGNVSPLKPILDHWVKTIPA